METHKRLNWAVIENPDNLICCKELGQAVEIFAGAVVRGLTHQQNYDVEDLLSYLTNTIWYENFGSKTKIKFNKNDCFSYISYGLNNYDWNVLEFEDVLIDRGA